MSLHNGDYAPRIKSGLRILQSNSTLIRRIRLSILALLVLFFSTGPARAGTVGFQPVVTYPVGPQPAGIALADFNGDGIRDLAVVNSGDSTVSILLGKGDGTFQAATTFAADGGSIAAADFNGDQRADLVVTGSNRVDVFLGNGDGTFQAARSSNSSTSGGAVVVADFDSDRRSDLLVTTPTGVGVLLGNGDGTFRSEVNYSVGALGSVVVGDFNGDNRTDVAVGPGVVVLLGNGDGTLQAPVSQDGLRNVRAAADFDNDGKLDLLVDNGFCLVVGCAVPMGVMFGNGDGTFKTPTVIESTSTYSALAADFNGDGNLDIARIGGVVEVFLGDGKGSFTSVGPPFPPSALFAGGAAVDLNGDKAPDIVVFSRNQGQILVLLNNTGSDFSISASALGPSILSPGRSATSTVGLKLLNAFDYPVSLACSVQPTTAGAPTCSLSPNSVRFDANGNATATLTINTSSASALLVNRSSPWRTRNLPSLSLAVLGITFLESGLGAGLFRKRRLLMLLVGSILLSGLILQLGCGGGAPQSTTYAITIRGTSGITQHSTTVSLGVQ